MTSEKRFTLTKPVKICLGACRTGKYRYFTGRESEIGFDENCGTVLRICCRNSMNMPMEIFITDSLIRWPVGMIPVAPLILDSLAKMGIQPMTQIAQSKKGEEQSQRIVIPAAIIKYKDRQLPVDLLKGVQRSREGQSPEQLYVNAENLLEYKFASTIDKLITDTLPAIGYLMGNGEPLDYRVYSLIQYLRENFRFGIVQLDSVPVIPGELDALIMVKPTGKFSDDEKRKLDQFVMRGGSLICMIDNLNAEMDSLQYCPGNSRFRPGSESGRSVYFDMVSESIRT